MKTDIYAQVSNHIAAQIEAGIAKGSAWRMPWRKTGNGPLWRPTNAVTKNGYRGVNTVLLWGAADQAGYTQPQWASFKQWQSKGASVRKGEKGSLIVFYKSLDVRDKSQPDNADATVSIPFLRATYVFNAAQVDGYEVEAQAPEVDTTKRLDAVEAFVGRANPMIRHGSDAAYYQPSTDQIVMPNRSQFQGDADAATEAYYGVLLHELTHWTGHKSRLDRLNNYVGEGRAFEELIAELGSAFLCAELGVSNAPREDHGHYLASWLKVIQSDSRAFFKAASAAEKACDFLKACEPASQSLAA